jgi:hypothetical protein
MCAAYLFVARALTPVGVLGCLNSATSARRHRWQGPLAGAARAAPAGIGAPMAYDPSVRSAVLIRTEYADFTPDIRIAALCLAHPRWGRLPVNCYFTLAPGHLHDLATTGITIDKISAQEK